VQGVWTHRKAKDNFIGYSEKHARAVLINASETAAQVRDAPQCGVCAVEYSQTYWACYEKQRAAPSECGLTRSRKEIN
jgi:hypothetical protein